MSNYKLIFCDEFNEPTLDLSKWTIVEGRGRNGWGNGESQYYTASEKNIFIKDNILHIKCIHEEAPDHHLEEVEGGVFGRNYTSGKITTKHKHSFKYGRIEVSAKMPSVIGSWPAIWLMPVNDNNERWPLCGEIDLMEHLGRNKNVIHHSLHTGLYNFQNNDSQYTIVKEGIDACNKFVEYAVEWTEDYFEFFIDKTSVGKLFKGQEERETNYEAWPFDKEFYLIINFAIGGFWGSEIDNSNLPDTMQIGYVKVYKKD